MADLLASIREQAARMSWIERARFIQQRGWEFTLEGWKSPHNQMLYDEESAVIEEMVRESESGD